MNSNEIRQKFLKFFESKGHVILPSASLLPVGDSSVLFTTAGMQPLVPYLMGTKHPSGTRLASVQKCVRTGDIEDIGDNRHLTFFEMLGNWSLGDYFKDESIAWSYEFLTSKEKGTRVHNPVE
jgi:alanyl-tRNA synthetase